jgi:hypothetical protein
MARLRLLPRGGDAEEPKPAPVRRPTPAALKRERRVLVRLREQRLRDLGGLLLEMYRRGTFREELLSEQCADLVAIETRLADVEAALTGPRRRVPRCTCGAPLIPGARFCASCGRNLQPQRAGDETIVAKPQSEP